MKRALLYALLTFGIGVIGGIVGARIVPEQRAEAPRPTAPGQVVAPADPSGMVALVKQVEAAVVNIDTLVRQRVELPGADLEDYFTGKAAPLELVQQGVGSGFIVRNDGLIVTNYHVVKGAQTLTITLANGNKYAGTMIGSDPSTDLALLRIEAKNLPTLKLADPKSLEAGQYVVAIGSPLGLQQTVTFGILSAVHRYIEPDTRVSYLQTDAAINPGNSGGPLLNLFGEVIGVNTAIAAQAQGIGFAIPVETLKVALPQLTAQGHVTHAWYGVAVADLPEDTSQMVHPVDHGVVVLQVESDSPAGKAGIQPGDVLLAMNGQALTDSAMLAQHASALSVGSDVELDVSRQGHSRTFRFKLDPRPARKSPVPSGG